MNRILHVLRRDVLSLGGDSFSDRLSHSYTVLLLLVTAAVFIFHNNTSPHIVCTFPDYYTQNEVNYAHQACWNSETYSDPPFVPQTNFPQDDMYGAHQQFFGPHKKIKFYRWAGLILIFQAVLFMLPRILWRLLNRKLGIAVNNVTDAAVESSAEPEARRKSSIITYIAKEIAQIIEEPPRNSYFLVLYIVCKLLYVINAIGHVFLVNSMLGHRTQMRGFDVITSWLRGQELAPPPNFPTTIICEYPVSVGSRTDNRELQCIQTANHFHQTLLVIIWFWIAFVFFASICSFVKLLITSFYETYRVRYVCSRLTAMDRLDNVGESGKAVYNFVHNYLGRDGFLLVRFIEENASDVISAHVTSQLWDFHRGRRTSVDEKGDNIEMGTNPRHIYPGLNGQKAVDI